jgi:Tfp pilus assembly protein PilE
MADDNRAHEQGFSTLELMVSMLIMVSLIQALSAGYIHVFSQAKKSKVRSGLDEQLKFLGDYFTYRMQGVGGGAVRPWASVWVEDNCAARASFPDCAGSDRVTLVTSDATVPECTIVGVVSATTLQIDAPFGTCCLTAAFGNRQAVVSNGDYYSQQFLTNVQTVACTVDLAPGQGFGGLNNPPVAPATWVGGSLSVVDVATLYLDSTSTELREFRDLNNNGTIDAGEQTVLADQVYDLQFALGYDSNPRDGRITDTASDTDEWLFNSNGPNEAFGLGGLTGALPSDLRMVSVGLILGEQGPGPGSGQVSVLNGPLRAQPGIQLSRSLTKFRFRNIGVFLLNG